MSPTPPTDDRAIGRVALRARVRALTDGALDPDPESMDRSVVAVVADGRAYYQTADRRGLGPGLRWAAGNDVAALTLIAEADVAPELARRASLLDADVEVWSARGPEVERAEPAPAPTSPPIPDAHRPLASAMAEAGARPVDDHGMLVAEVAGLEVARVVDAEDGSGPRLSVGVGQADRELQGYVNGHLDDDTNLRRAIAEVARHRRPGSAVHPLSRLARQRWLRSILLDAPGIVDLANLEPVAPLRPRETLLGAEPAAARGPGAVVVCSVGVDLDLFPEAVDYRNREEPEAELIVVVPERDRRLVIGPFADLVPRLRVMSLDLPWEG